MKQLKKFCMTALCCGMLLGITALSVSANSTYMRGDANSDGKITVADVIAIQRNLLGGSTSHFSAEAADVDGKGLLVLSGLKDFLSQTGNHSANFRRCICINHCTSLN